MRAVREGTESDATLALPAATPASIASEWVRYQHFRYAHEMRRGTHAVLGAMAALRPQPAR